MSTHYLPLGIPSRPIRSAQGASLHFHRAPSVLGSSRPDERNLHAKFRCSFLYHLRIGIWRIFPSLPSFTHCAEKESRPLPAPRTLSLPTALAPFLAPPP